MPESGEAMSARAAFARPGLLGWLAQPGKAEEPANARRRVGWLLARDGRGARAQPALYIPLVLSGFLEIPIARVPLVARRRGVINVIAHIQAGQRNVGPQIHRDGVDLLNQQLLQG